MNHRKSMSARSAPDPRDAAPDCAGELALDGGGFWDDIRWVVYRCQVCNQRIATVGGGRHWWNYILKRSDLA
jgi:hypothetical protein